MAKSRRDMLGILNRKTPFRTAFHLKSELTPVEVWPGLRPLCRSHSVILRATLLRDQSLLRRRLSPLLRRLRGSSPAQIWVAWVATALLAMVLLRIMQASPYFPAQRCWLFIRSSLPSVRSIVCRLTNTESGSRHRVSKIKGGPRAPFASVESPPRALSIDPGRIHEPWGDSGLGTNCRRRPRRRIRTVFPRSDCRDASAGSRNLAPLSSDRAKLTRTPAPAAHFKTERPHNPPLMRRRRSRSAICRVIVGHGS